MNLRMDMLRRQDARRARLEERMAVLALTALAVAVVATAAVWVAAFN